MVELHLGAARSGNGALDILCLGAHSDDVEIGCGGTILALLRQRPDVRVHWVVFSGSGEREVEARCSAQRFLSLAQDVRVDVHAFRDGFFPYVGGEIKDVFEQLKQSTAPDVVFTHHRADAHQDHRVIAQLTWNTFRDHLILEYEVPKYDGGLLTPNVYVPLDDDARRDKVAFLMQSFDSQRSKRWFTPETFEGLLRLRGIECASPTGYAEGFHAPKALLGWRVSA